jgi:ABC-type glycerol-3-phosphate transport system substrate-binding protein
MVVDMKNANQYITQSTCVICVLLCLLILGGCSFPGKDDKDTIKLLWFGSEEETKVIRDLVSEFERENPDVHVTIQMVEWFKFNEKLLTMLLGRRAPDISRISVQWCRRYAELGAFTDISDLVSADDLKDFVDSRLASCRYNDMLYGLPHSSISLMMFYNADLVEKAGIQVPLTPEESWTWDELDKNSRMTLELEGVKYGWSTFRGWFPLLTFFYQNDGRMFDDTLTRSTFLTPENVETLTWLVGEYHYGVAPSSSWTGGDSGAQLFMRGLCTFHITGNWSLTSFSNRITDFPWGVTYLPRNIRRAANVGGENLVVFNTRKREKAVRLLNYLTGREQLAQFCSKALFIPPRSSLLDSNFEYEKFNDHMQKFVIQSRDFEPEWATEQSLPAFSELEQDLLKNVELAILGQKTPKEALQSVDQAFENLKK